jgi:hypothetical protein
MVSKKSFEELTTIQYAQEFFTRKSDNYSERSERFFSKAESEINNNYISKMDFT